MHYPHRTHNELRDPREDRLPEPIKYFIPACQKLPQIFGSREAIVDTSPRNRISEVSSTPLCTTWNLNELFNFMVCLNNYG